MNVQLIKLILLPTFLFVLQSDSLTIKRKYHINKVSFSNANDNTKNYIKLINHSIHISIENGVGIIIISNEDRELEYLVNDNYDVTENDTTKALIFKECFLKGNSTNSNFTIVLTINKEKHTTNLLVVLPNGNSYYYFNLKN